jgi:hypothetical protein
MGCTLLPLQTLPPASTAKLRCSLKGKSNASFRSFRKHFSQRLYLSNFPVQHLPSFHLVCPPFPSVLLVYVENIQNKSKKYGGVRFRDNHPPDSFSSRTGASAWLQQVRERGKSQNPENRAHLLPPISKDKVSPIPGGRGCQVLQLLLFPSLSTSLPELQGESAEQPTEVATWGEATPPRARRHGAVCPTR